MGQSGVCSNDLPHVFHMSSTFLCTEDTRHRVPNDVSDMYDMVWLNEEQCWQVVMAALDLEGLGLGTPKRPHVPGLIDAGLVPLQSLMHNCWHQVSPHTSL